MSEPCHRLGCGLLVLLRPALGAGILLPVTDGLCLGPGIPLLVMVDPPFSTPTKTHKIKAWKNHKT